MDATTAPTFVDFLIQSNRVTGAALDTVKKIATGEDLGELAHTFVKLGHISAVDYADALSVFTKIPRFKKSDFPDDPVDIQDLSLPFLRAQKVVPLSLSPDGVRVAILNPDDPMLLEAMAFSTGLNVIPLIATDREIEDAITRLYDPNGNEVGTIPLNGDANADDVARLEELAEDAPVIRLVDRVIEDAFELGASDIHFEPYEEGVRIRLRVDGMLIPMPEPSPDLKAAIISRLKIMAHLDIAERRLPQDGRIKLRLHGKLIDFRVSTTSTAFGESVVLRILDRGTLPRDFSALGFADDYEMAFRKALSRPEGIILVTGPTGSGKTTTLYAALQYLNTPEKKILTVEDPIEYMLDGINQVQVEPKIGRDFASTLRAFLRQDPDILMVGEIRDRETAKMAIESAMTGHLVLSTLHTSDAASAITRLLEMAVEDFLIASTVSLVIGQRLVRKLCMECREPYTLSFETNYGLRELKKYKGMEFYRHKGCDACRGSGYAGRVSILEMMPISAAIRAHIMARPEAQDIEATAVKEGMRTLLLDGLRLAAQGVTTIEEILRVTKDE